MGCGGSKVDNLPLVIRCRERKDLMREAADHRYALAAAHLSYFRSLKDVGYALQKFVDEELVIASPFDSPVLTLPSDEGKSKKKKKPDTGSRNNTTKSSSTDTSMSHSGSISHVHSVNDDDGGRAGEDSHLHLNSDSENSGHLHIHDSDDGSEDEGPKFSPLPRTDWGPYGMNHQPFQTAWNPYGYGVNPDSQNWGSYGGSSSSYAYYMKKSAPKSRTVIHEAEQRNSVVESSYVYSSPYSSYPHDNGGFLGFPMSTPRHEPSENRQTSSPLGPPPPPSPKVSTWDFLNPFDAFDNGYLGYYSHQRKHGYGSIASSPDSNEVREREGIPDLEEVTETEVYGDDYKGKKVKEDIKKISSEGTGAVPSQKSEGSTRAIPSQTSEGNFRAGPSQGSEGSSWAVHSPPSEGGNSRRVPPLNNEATRTFNAKLENSSPDSIISMSIEDGYAGKKGVSFEVEEASTHDAESSKLSSLNLLSTHGTRDLQEVVSEIRDEFEIASSFGKEVALMLEVGKLPHQPRFTKVILSRILYLIAPSLASSNPSSRQSVKLAFRTMKLAKAYYGDTGKDINLKPINLSSTLEKLYAWERKLYKEVKDEERLRVIYEKKCRSLKVLDDRGAESSKIDATQASIKKLLTKLNICIKAIDAISSRIHKLRDEELQPQVTELIQGEVRMWRSILKCHQKQFQAITESKSRTLRVNTGSRRDSSLRATLELEMELCRWCNCFNDWINTQKSYIESLNGWLLQCLYYEPEETPDGAIPFSPDRIGAPLIFVICNDWYQAMETISEARVATAMHNFASSLRRLWERQDGEQRQRLKAEYVSKDIEKRLRKLGMERGRMESQQDSMSQKTGVSVVPSESGVSPLDDLKVDLDLMKERMAEERARHKEAVKLVHDAAASSSLQGGLVPIFKALEHFASEALKSHQQVRIPNTKQG